MINPEVYRRAAESLQCAYAYTCCGAIVAHTSFVSYEEHIEEFAKYFKPQDKGINSYWWPVPFGLSYSYDDQLLRQLALLLMAEIVEEEE